MASASGCCREERTLSDECCVARRDGTVCGVMGVHWVQLSHVKWRVVVICALLGRRGRTYSGG